MTAPPAVVRVVIADDQDLVRDGLRAVLDADPAIEVVGEAADGVEALQVVAATRPQVALIDVRMPRLDGIAATRHITAGADPPYVLVLTTFDLDDYVLAALRAGASGFLLKDATRQRIIESIHRVVAGEALLAPSVTRRLVDHFVRTGLPPRSNSLSTLTPRETDVLRLMARGLSNAEIAERLNLGDSTVKSYVSNILVKLGARDRVQAAVAAYDAGLVVPRETLPGH